MFIQQVLRRVTALPDVISATATIALPPFGGPVSEVVVPGKTHSERWDAMFQMGSEGWFQTLGRRLIRGHLFSETDLDAARQVAVINQKLAQRFFGQEDPIGQKIKFNLLDQLPDTPHNAYFEIIGIVADAKNQGLQNPTMPEAILPYSISGFGGHGLLLRTREDALRLLPTVRREVRAVDPNVALTDTGSIEDFLKSNSYLEPQFALITVGAFTGLGLLLVAIGVFCVMAYSVSLQTHEIGIRMALGAQGRDVLHAVLMKGLRLMAVGMIAGLLTSLGLTRYIASQIWGVSPTDPWTFSAAATTILVAGLGACLLPARRAARVDPLIALRYE